MWIFCFLKLMIRVVIVLRRRLVMVDYLLLIVYVDMFVWDNFLFVD